MKSFVSSNSSVGYLSTLFSVMALVHILFLGKMLEKMGLKHQGVGTHSIEIEGKEKYHLFVDV